MVKRREIVCCYVGGTGEEQIQVFKAEKSEEHEKIGYDVGDNIAVVWKNSIVTGKETLVIPLGRLVFIREVEDI